MRISPVLLAVLLSGCAAKVKSVVVEPTKALLTGPEATATLTASARDEKGEAIAGAKVQWSSSAPEIAGVENGKVTARKSGEAAITATSGAVSGKADVLVSIPASVEIEPRSAELMGLGQVVEFRAVVKDENGNVCSLAPEWSATDPSIVAVFNGEAKALGAGTTTVVASVPGQKAEATVTVNLKPPDVSRVSVEPAKQAVKVGATAQLGAKVADRGGAALANVTVEWTSSDPKVAMVSRTGLVTAVKQGRAVITARAGGKSASAEVTVAKAPVAKAPAAKKK